MTVALLDLKPYHCRWPLDEGGFCGCRKVRGAYCEEHASRAYKPRKEDDTGPKGSERRS